ncbi:alpha/beta fold hydrolase [Cellulomonas soli]|uniref:Alpha/beta hydrolase n=1 Tax=Cellulomonas soli TaxID=931535 RepID=A0A512PED5_9CELL|nr:alpha/beta hydrolase [Cellulomonas soli]NYI58930.1 pimeloyl-ACP methyl ester carboxylesterase [Cellulomonas soli]GEP69577.1 alpha/beta hydrolase [Cellulomonas soli]
MSVKQKDNPGTTRWGRVRRRLRWVLGGLLALVVLTVVGVKATDAVMTARERDAHAAPGELVEVDGHTMHVAVSGSGDTTVVLLPGLGTAAPVLDFEPLTRELSTWATVAVVEPFGYGWSDATDDPMLPSDVAADVQKALDAAGVDGPVVMAAHSIGGLYAQAFADAYPERTVAVVGLDPTMPRTDDVLPASEKEEDPFADPIPASIELLARGGWVRVMQAIGGDDPQMFSGATQAQGYSEENLALQTTVSNWSAVSSNVVWQAAHLEEAVDEVRDLTFSPDVPVLVFTADPAGERPAWRDAASTDYLRGSGCARDVPLVGEHYVHHEHAAEISAQIESFLAECLG